MVDVGGKTYNVFSKNAATMLDRTERRRAWDRAHQEKPVSGQPAEAVVAFATHLRSTLPPGAPILDAGCGRGRNARYLSQAGFTTYGCDLSPVAVAVASASAKASCAPVAYQVADLTFLPYVDNVFAAGVCVHVLPYHFIANIVKGVQELWRVLRPGGWLYLDLLHGDDAEYGCGRELEANTFLDPDGVPIHFTSRQEADELLRGFAVQRMSRLELGARPRVAWLVWARKEEGKRR